MGSNECISALGVGVVSNRKKGSISEITCVEQEEMLIIISVRTRTQEKPSKKVKERGNVMSNNVIHAEVMNKEDEVALWEC